jgi:hypothetical protein
MDTEAIGYRSPGVISRSCAIWRRRLTSHVENAAMVSSLTNSSNDKVALLNEATEALTALNSYLTGLRQIFKEQPDGLLKLVEVIEASMGQAKRADEAIRKLKNIFRRETVLQDSHRL